MLNKKIALVAFAIMASGCSSVSHQNDMDVKKPILKSQKTPLAVVSETIYNSQSKHLKIKDDSVYYLSSINNGAEPMTDAPVTMIFIEEYGLKNVAKGYSGCNDYYFKYQISENVFVLGEVYTTNFKCDQSDAVFENYLFKELSKRPNIKINKDYVVIKGSDSEMLLEKKITPLSPNLRSSISSTRKSDIVISSNEFESEDNIIFQDDFIEPSEIKAVSLIPSTYPTVSIISEDKNIEDEISAPRDSINIPQLAKSVEHIVDEPILISSSVTNDLIENDKSVVKNDDGLDNDKIIFVENKNTVEEIFLSSKTVNQTDSQIIYNKNLNISKELLNNIHIYNSGISREENISIRNKAIVIKNKLENESKVQSIKLNDGQTVPFIEYKVKKNDTLKNIILSTYETNKNPTWVMLILRLKQIEKLNSNIKNIDNIYPNQKLYIPIFKN